MRIIMKKILCLLALAPLLCFGNVTSEVKIYQNKLSNWSEFEIEREAPLFSYTLIAIEEDGSQILLSDGSVWNIGLWSKSVVKNWNIGDTISLSYFPQTLLNPINTIRFENWTQESIAWGTIKSRPYGENARTITEIDGRIITFNDGSQLKAENEKQIRYSLTQEGDVCSIFGRKDKTDKFVVWNHTSEYILLRLFLAETSSE